MLPGVHFEPAKNWSALINYCKKEDTRADGAVPVHEVNNREYLTLDKAMMKIADVFDDDGYRADVRKGLQFPLMKCWKSEVLIKDYFWKAVRIFVRTSPPDIGYFVRPDVERAWVNTYEVWLEKRQTDRQIRIEITPEHMLGLTGPAHEILNSSINNATSCSQPDASLSPCSSPRSSHPPQSDVSIPALHGDV